MSRSTSLTVKCPLCGNEFDQFQAGCSQCPFHGKCELVRCPNCGYEFVAESKIVVFFKKLFKLGRKSNDQSRD